MSELDDTKVALDFAMTQGELSYPCMPGERVMIYTPTFIWAGTVSRVGPLAVELNEDVVLVYETGTTKQQSEGKWEMAEGLGKPWRTMWTSVVGIQVLPQSAKK